ncbi:MAG: cyclic nucleotide-binding domain-containing protein [Magnetococcales bacterium]|nr:cyclic nucleotide-binding domain-containing protein [Magnetococcales bacterium]
MVPTAELKRTDLFNGLDDDIIETIASFTSLAEFSDGEVILSEDGNKGVVIRDLYLLMEGDVIVKKNMADYNLWKKLDISTMNNEVFGEVGWLLGENPSAEVSSVKNCKMFIVDGEELFSLCENNPEAGVIIFYRLAAILAARLVNRTKKS